MKTPDMIREHRDASGRLTIDIGESYLEFEMFASQLNQQFGKPVRKVGGAEQCYWDYGAAGVPLVLHCDNLAGVSVHIDDGSSEEVLRRIALELVH